MNVEDSREGDGWVMYLGDSTEVLRGIPDNSVGLCVYSPPFSNLFIYGPSERDLGNSADDAEFLEHYRFVARELYRVTRPGRLCAVHCKDLVDYKGSSGRAGLRDFPGDLVRVHEAEGWKYHSRITVWKCPVEEQRKTKAHGLLYKQLRRDSSFSRQGLAEYVLVFRKWAQDGDEVAPVEHTKESFPLRQWQEWASPVWMDVDHKDVLNVEIAREDADEKHMCPLALPLIQRCVLLWSNPGDIVLSPFAGVGSEGVVSLKEQRRFVGVELKRAYWERACRYLDGATRQLDLFAGAGA